MSIEEIKKDDEIKFKENLRQTLEITQETLQAAGIVPKKKEVSFERAKSLVQEFEPVPWFIWRLSNFVFGKSGKPTKASEGLTLGLKKLLLAAASDRVLGKAGDITTTREAYKVLRSDVIAAASVIQAISRKLKTKNNEKLWQPILDDAIIRAHIGFFVGQLNSDFSPGRGMLAGFAGRIGLVVLLATGSQMDAEQAMRLLADGKTLREVGEKIYGIDPLQISALILSASGCGKDASFGTMSYANLSANETVNIESSFEQQQWLAAFAITEAVRTQCLETIRESLWSVLGFRTQSDKDDLEELVKILIRKGHGWDWMI
jgi:hypothetical protein